MVVYQISKALVKRGHEVVVYTSDMRNLSARVKRGVEVEDGIKIVRFKNISSTFSDMSGIVITPRMAEAFDKEIQNFDIIHLHEARSFQHLLVHKYCNKRGVPYIVQAHGILGCGAKSVTERMLRFVYDNLIGLKIFRDAAKVVALTAVEAKQYTNIGVLMDKIEVIPNGIDLSEYDNLPSKGEFKKRFNIPEDKKIILYLGRIHKIKGIDHLVKAYAYLKKKMNCNDALLVIAGPDDGYLNEVKSLTYDLVVSDSVLFTGPLYGKAKLEAYVDADVFVLPSRYEAFGNVVLEAYACSKPVIASGVGGLNDLVVDGETGLLFEAGSHIQLAEKLLYLLNNSDDALRMGLNGRRFVERNFNWDKIVPRIERVYLDSVDKQ